MSINDTKPYSLPYDLIDCAPGDAESVCILKYLPPASESRKAKVILHHHMFGLLQEGQKGVFYPQKNVVIDNKQLLLLTAGNCITSEKTVAENGRYSAILLFFDTAALGRFMVKHPGLSAERKQGAKTPEPFIVLEKDSFLQNFIASLDLLLARNAPISEEWKVMKFEELMLYLFEKMPSAMLDFYTAAQGNDEEWEIRKTVETNIENNITVEELAFLCNTSLSTFKRRFTKIYGTSPNKWMLQKRMEMAADMLRQQGSKPSDVYYKVGYENLSSFIESFKQTFGVTPGVWQQEKLNV
jgi:AraC-like DNA-binding protein